MQHPYCSVLEALDRDKAPLMELSVPRRLEPGELLVLSGDEVRWLHLVERGVLKLSALGGEGEEATIGLAVEGALVGLTSLLADVAQPFDVIALTDCELAAIPAETFLRIAESHPAALIEIAREIAHGSLTLARCAGESRMGDGSARLAGRLMELAELLGHMKGGAIELRLPVGQRDLGQLAGMCRENTCKTLRRLRSKGVLDYRGRNFRIMRPDLLEKIRCGERVAKPCR